jgi:PEP-CTERM motif
MRILSRSSRSMIAGLGMMVTVLLGATSASASTIVFQHAFPTPNTTNAWCTSCFGSFQEFDQFTLASATIVTQIDAMMYLGNPNNFSFEYSVWNPTRTTQLFSQTFTPAQLTLTSLGGPAYNVTAFLTGLTLGPGAYALSIFDATGYVGWFQSHITVDGQSFQTSGGGGTGGDQAFVVWGDDARSAVPEPGTLVLLGTGLSLVAARMRRRTQRS